MHQLTIIAFSGAHCVEVSEDRPMLSEIPEFVDFSDLQITNRFAERLTHNLDFKVAIFFNVTYLENVTNVIL